MGPEAEAEGDGVGDFSSEYTVAQEGPEAGPHGEAPAERGVSARAGGGAGGGGGTSLGLVTATRGCVKPSSPSLLEKRLGLVQFSQEVRGACWWPRDSWTVDS